MREHYFTCKANCDWADEYSKPPFADGDICLAGHTDHECDCDYIAIRRGEREAEAAAEHLAEIGLDTSPL